LDELHWSRSIFALGCWLTAATIDLMVQGYFTWFGWAQRVKIGWGRGSLLPIESFSGRYFLVGEGALEAMGQAFLMCDSSWNWVVV
jgi:hypothetical protein